MPCAKANLHYYAQERALLVDLRPNLANLTVILTETGWASSNEVRTEITTAFSPVLI
jgi:hypothetical protein